MPKRYRTSKFIREYGMTLERLAKKYNMSATYLRTLHDKGDLHRFIEEQEKEKAEAPSK